MVRVRKLALAIAAVSALSSGMAHAVGLGELTLRSALNQPLRADIEVFDAGGLEPDELKSMLASPEEFGRAGIDRPFFLSDLRFSTEVGANGKGVIHVTSTKPVREPYLNFLVEVLWPSGRVLREYTMLLDPPLYSPQTAAAAAPQLPISAPPRAAAPATAPVQRTSPPRPDSYRTRRNDTLWEIAARAGGPSRVQQTMLAIQDLNPGAFISGNINQLRTGQVLRLPDNAQIERRSGGEAAREVAAQNAAWRQARQAPARQLDASRRDAAAAEPEAPARGDNLRLVAPDSNAASAGRDAASGGADENARLTEELAVARESLDTSQRENEELKSRLSDLQSQLDKLQRLIELKDQRLAELEAAAAAPAAETPAAPAETPAQQPEAAGQPDEAGLLALLSSPMMLALMGGGVVLLLLLALLVVSRRNRAEEAQEPVLGKGRDDTFAADELPDDLGLHAEQAPEEEPRDPVTEANLLIAYGRFSQAAELLERAIDNEPQRHDLRLKLMEVEAEQGNRQGFERQERELRELGAPESELAALRARYAGLLGAGLAAAATGAAAYAAEQHEQPLDDEDDLGLDDLDFSGLGMDEPAAAGSSQGAEADDPLDFEALQREFSAPAAETPADEDLGLDFDLGAVERPQQDSEPAFDEALFSGLDDAPESPAAEPVGTLDSLDLDDLDFSEPALDMPADKPAEEGALDDAPLPDDFDLSLDDEEAPSPAEAAAEPLESEPLEDALFEEQPDAAPAGAASLADEDDDFDFLAGTDEIATKLDLAQAYLDMGDNEGARDILGEVLAEGSEEQQQAARDLMERLG